MGYISYHNNILFRNIYGMGTVQVGLISNLLLNVLSLERSVTDFFDSKQR